MDKFWPWLRIAPSDHGSTIELHRLLLPASTIHNIVTETDSGDQAFVKLFPKGWRLDSWLQGENCNEYAIILRHTEIQEQNRQVHLLVGGFTERSTAAAASYLASEWKALTLNNVRRRDRHRNSNGDFMIILTGMTAPNHEQGWTSARGARVITPEVLSDRGIVCEWAQRVESPNGPLLLPQKSTVTETPS